MTPKQIQNRRKTIKNKRSFWLDKLMELQSICQHPNVNKKLCSITENYDSNVDSYWIKWSCNDCGATWNTDVN